MDYSLFSGMISIKPPATEYTSLNEIGKFSMIWTVSITMIPIFILLLGMHLIFGDKSWTTSTGALILATSNVVVLYKTRKYKLVGAWTVILAVLLCQIVIFVVDDSHVLSDVMWCILVAFFSFFLFGSIIGSLVLLINLSGLIYYVMIASQTDLVSKGIINEDLDYKMVVNVYYVAIALSFIIYKMIDNNKKVNESYEKEIQRNEVLLKEIHHRVKNNLQIVSSLLRLQSVESENENVKEHFQEAVSRIRSMSLIHEKMYQNADLAEVDIQSYLISLTQDISSSIETDCKVDMEVNSEINKMNINVLVPLALIFNELITNSIKHGFAGRNQGKISVQIIHTDGKVEVIYLDNGQWREPEENRKTFGVDLIDTLVNQLDATYTLNNESGTQYIIQIDQDHFS